MRKERERVCAFVVFPCPHNPTKIVMRRREDAKVKTLDCDSRAKGTKLAEETPHLKATLTTIDEKTNYQFVRKL